MIDYIQHSPWEIIEEGFNPDHQEKSESIFSLGNGKMGQRANFEEYYSGRTLQGTYISGIFYPDKTRVGWWKNGYPEYFAKILNAPDWRGIKISVNKEKIDLFKCKIYNFRRVLNMKHGFLEKSFTVELSDGKMLSIESIRFLSIVKDELGLIKYSVSPVNFSGTLKILTDLDANVKNKDSNYNENFWSKVDQAFVPFPYIVTETKKTLFHACNSFTTNFQIDGQDYKPLKFESHEKEKYLGFKYFIPLKEKQTLTIYKYAAVTSSLYYSKDNLIDPALNLLDKAQEIGFEKLFDEHKSAWGKKWEDSDIIIENDVSAQQAIRFNIFQLQQTYNGSDERMNIGPKGFTGEKYGGVTYWDTEAYCLPFYMSTSDSNVAKNLLKYRYKHLTKAIENAENLGFNNGSALFPMVTINGDECHNEWEITFEEIHRNAAIAYAIFNYVRYTGDVAYLSEFGLEVLIGISRFWSKRVNFSEDKQEYVMLGVTGPNEYENNVNNNWYTSTMALWTMRYTIEAVNIVKNDYADEYNRIIKTTKFKDEEVDGFNEIINNMYLPFDKKRNIFLQQDGFLDKELIPTSEIPENERPINKYWSWDRILRSCYIKQADVLQGLFFLEHEYDKETIKRNFDFYEPFTVHESSLSPSVYSIIAAKIGNQKKAYDLYLRTARLDLDDYNDEVYEGLHITSMAGTWMSIIYGFAGMKILDGKISFTPFLPNNWTSVSFRIKFRKNLLNVQVAKNEIIISNLSNTEIELFLFDEKYSLDGNDEIIIVR